MFYLCQAAQKVFDHHVMFKVKWLEIDDPPATYRMAYEDSVEAETVIGTVKLKRAGKGQLTLGDVPCLPALTSLYQSLSQ